MASEVSRVGCRMSRLDTPHPTLDTRRATHDWPSFECRWNYCWRNHWTDQKECPVPGHRSVFEGRSGRVHCFLWSAPDLDKPGRFIWPHFEATADCHTGADARAGVREIASTAKILESARANCA